MPDLLEKKPQLDDLNPAEKLQAGELAALDQIEAGLRGDSKSSGSIREQEERGPGSIPYQPNANKGVDPNTSRVRSVVQLAKNVVASLVLLQCLE